MNMFRLIPVVDICGMRLRCAVPTFFVRFVPALNVIADYFNIPDDISGKKLPSFMFPRTWNIPRT